MQKKFNPVCRELVIIMHCLTGCDTASAFYGQAKSTGISTLQSLSSDEIGELRSFITPYDDIDHKKEDRGC